MPVKRRAGKRRPDLPTEAVDWLHDGTGGAWIYFVTEEEKLDLWREFEDEVVAEHVSEWPGTRPERWWQFSAPEPRHRVGGVGTPSHERLAFVLHLYLGVPESWITCDALESYRLGVPALDPTNPPMFESEAAYLARLDLLLPGERSRINEKDFAAESVVDILGLDIS